MAAVNMVQGFHGDLMICLQTHRPPNKEEWTRYIDALASRDPRALRTLVLTDGGAPDFEQRRAVNRVLAGKTTAGAIVSRSLTVRSAVTALSWFNPEIKAFSPDRIDDAFEHVGVPLSERAAVSRMVLELRDRLGAPIQCIPRSIGEGAIPRGPAGEEPPANGR